MNDDILINELMPIIRDEIILYKNIKKHDNNSDDVLNTITHKIRSFIELLDDINTDFKSIGIYKKYDLSSYFINSSGIVINKKKIIRLYNNSYYLKPYNYRRPIHFGKNELTDFIHSG